MSSAPTTDKPLSPAGWVSQPFSWSILVVTLVVLLGIMVKDPLGDRFILRFGSQVLGLFVAVTWISQNPSVDLLRRYWPLLLYVVTLFLSAILSSHPALVCLQAMSVAAIMILFCVFQEEYGAHHRAHRAVVSGYSIGVFAFLVYGLYLTWVDPGRAYEESNEGLRFRGYFGEPATAATAAGTLLGFAIFTDWSMRMRIAVWLIGAPCLFMTGSRSFWVAGLCAVFV